MQTYALSCAKSAMFLNKPFLKSKNMLKTNHVLRKDPGKK